MNKNREEARQHRQRVWATLSKNDYEEIEAAAEEEDMEIALMTRIFIRLGLQKHREIKARAKELEDKERTLRLLRERE